MDVFCRPKVENYIHPHRLLRRYTLILSQKYAYRKFRHTILRGRKLNQKP